ncbi:iron ABC transporter permease [Pseudoroseomonas cervicalis]|uniref:ABC transporter permease n=1 Tax=Teichococcus cervicalis TaxID=204525 RepID=UPI00278771F7|nr:iron ABC transporter permease [Pseudoroseomonas cervicalis]MDQ1078902.1 iron(III) transport system permease protein [Pseudoroseomonas cervicalis]
MSGTSITTPPAPLSAPAPALPAPARRRVPLWARAGWLVALLVALPVLAVLANAAAPLWTGSGTGAVWHHILRTNLLPYLGNSLQLGALVALMAGVTGIGCAWLVTACRFPGRRLLEAALLLPMAMPAYVCGYLYTWLLDAAGPVQSGIRDLTGLRWGQYWFPEIRSLPGAALMLAAVLYPYVYLLCRAAFLQQSSCLIEASRTLGLSLRQSFFRVALPLARPALAAGIGLVLMETLADFGTVDYFAVRTFTTGIYETWFGLGDRQAASQLAACLMGLVALLVVAEHASRGGRRYHATGTRQAPLRPTPLSGWKGWAAMLFCALPVLVGFVIPAGGLLHLMLDRGDAMDPANFLPFARNSLLLAGTTALLGVALAALLGWGVRLYPTPWSRLANRLAGLGYAVPGSVIAVGTLVPFGLLDNALDAWLRARFGMSSGLLLSGTMVALVFAYLVRFLAVGQGAVESGLARLRPSLFQAARVLGCGPGQAIARVEAPLARGALLTAAVLIFVDTMKELPATLIVRPFDLDTLAVRVHNLASDERLAEASTAALLIVAVGLVPVLVLLRAMRRG